MYSEYTQGNVDKYIFWVSDTKRGFKNLSNHWLEPLCGWYAMS